MVPENEHLARGYPSCDLNSGLAYDRAQVPANDLMSSLLALEFISESCFFPLISSLLARYGRREEVKQGRGAGTPRAERKGRGSGTPGCNVGGGGGVCGQAMGTTRQGYFFLNLVKETTGTGAAFVVRGASNKE
ncbi:hypothetical protein RUM43_003303 [Polyplax serrata]|uniref:Uncharacterized protein n=1 Tax=Polyplax serrata TaxID=468196 RepID=A0AAN8PH75_POLSC